MMKSFMARPLEVERRWYVVDADGKTLGRLSTEIARVLRGKHKAQYTPHVDVGDFVVVVNADRVVVTGRKAEQKVYRRPPGHPGGGRAAAGLSSRAGRPSRRYTGATRVTRAG